jgi:hypothetical protein
MHLNVFCHIAQHQRLQVLNPFVQEVPLELDDTLGDLVDGSLTLMDAPDQPDRRSEFFLDILPISLNA